jgi:DNA-binding beta-propeller fold protein YncE
MLMAPRRTQSSRANRKVALVVTLASLVMAAGFVVSSGDQEQTTRTRALGSDRLVAWEQLPELNGPICEFVPASASEEMFASLMQSSGSAGSAAAQSATAPPRPGDAQREQVMKRQAIATVSDPHFAYAGIVVDPIRNEVVIAEENLSSLLVYDRLENTPPTAAMSEPKRMIGGEATFLEYACSLYVDPETGDIYGINNDTMNWMPVFGRDAKGNVTPKRKLATPHTTFGIVADEERQELLMTIQDDHAVVVFPKTAKDEDKAVRVLQGKSTRLADPHGIALDPKRGEIFITNWGTSNERPPLGEGGGGSFGRGAARADWPVGRNRTFPSSGKIEPPSITVYPKDAKGDTAPLRVIQGPKTQLDWPTALAVHPDRGEIFVANDTADSVIVFRSDANGDVAPIRVIKGPRTMVKNPTGVTVDLKNNELWVANFGSHAATVFPIDAEGNVTPKRVIRSGPVDAPSAMLSNPHTVAYDSKREEILVAN